MSKLLVKILLLSLLISTAAFSAEQPKDATSFTKEKNAQVLKELPFSNEQDYEDAQKGFIGTDPNLEIKTSEGRVIFDLKNAKFVMDGDAPATVNPSLWRVAQLDYYNGLFKVTDRVYQIRTYDASNMTIIEGDKGLIIIDPLTTVETSKRALDLYYKYRPQKPINTVIYSHSHVDHYGGVKGIVDEKDVKSGKIKIYAPEGFLKEAISENVYAGNAMGRRSVYSYANLLSWDPKQRVDLGIAKMGPLGGQISLIPPTNIIKKQVEQKNIDGIKIEFVLALGTEAPAEMIMYFPQFNLLDTAEDAVHSIHNLYTLRGAQVRDAVAWWKAIDAMLERYGDKVEAVIAQHQWPKWGNENINYYLKKQRNAYKYIHDQTLYWANQGYTMDEIAEILTFPPTLQKEWSTRGYYGSVSHNSKAVYQRYLGWYDGNPADLNPLPPVESAKKYVEYMGGSKAVMAKAKESFKNGDYRWVAEVMNKVVFAEPDNTEAKNLEADALEQLGYQAENATWRAQYLSGAFELRNGVNKSIDAEIDSPDTMTAMTTDMFLDYLGIKLNSKRAEGKNITMNLEEPDTKEKYIVSLEDSVLVYRQVKKFTNTPDVTLSIFKSTLNDLTLGKTTVEKEALAGNIKVTGDQAKLKELFSLMDNFDPTFNIITP